MKIVLRMTDFYDNVFGIYNKDVLQCEIIGEHFKKAFVRYNKFRNGFYLAWLDGYKVKQPNKLINENKHEN